ncbi:hypothetical protein CIL05_13600 [Virgibacillus profundi]|uniref:DUF3679 domain-containing protein n=1 Tax=Virgibacillus profundi TaxID=2024555 RepID=A0A2A2ID06_9BACI|nr:hypothetical protein [Virgibacillus profundi]PAV29010.1 hypothetical protein CIL05_13600 [Virgibacillus profundi]PXY53179.1 hypothetical protein CIT14_13725 [Virgibacillus profundi]
MVRSFIVLLLFALFFLTGMLYGMDKENNTATDDSVETIESVDSVKNEEKQIEIVEVDGEPVQAEEVIVNSNKPELDDQPIHITEKTASFLEAGVKGFYEVVVQILHQISQLFF